MSTPIPPEVAHQIGACLFAGRKIEAIKHYRTHTGARLATAKAAVEALEAELRAREPGRFTATPVPAGRGCLIGMVLLIAVALALALLLVRHT